MFVTLILVSLVVHALLTSALMRHGRDSKTVLAWAPPANVLPPETLAPTTTARAESLRSFLPAVAAAAAAATVGAAVDSDKAVAQREICIIARTYSGHTAGQLLSFSSSVLRAAKQHRVRVFFAVTDMSKFRVLPSIVASMNRILGRHFLYVSPRSLERALMRIPVTQFNISAENDYGFIVTDLVMEDLLAEPGCEYVLVTNGDNLYTPSFFTRALAGLDTGVDAVATHFVSRYNYTADVIAYQRDHLQGCGPQTPGPAHEFVPLFREACLDLGASLFRKSLLQRTGARFILNDLRHKDRKDYITTRHGYRDGLFFETLVNASATTRILSDVLFVHQ